MRKLITVFIIIAVMLISIFLQINLLNCIPLFGVCANLGIVIVVGISLMSGRLVGGLIGLFYGLIIDIVFSKLIGINVFLYFLVGILTGHISNGFSKDNTAAMVMVVFITTGLFELATVFIISWLYEGAFGFINVIITILLESVYNMILTVLLHKFIVELGEIINKSKKSYYLL